MIYPIETYSVDDLLTDSRLSESVKKHSRSALTDAEVKDRITMHYASAMTQSLKSPELNKAKEFVKAPVALLSKSKIVDESDHALPPCGECGGTHFVPTGTCHVCAQCGASQGCS